MVFFLHPDDLLKYPTWVETLCEGVFTHLKDQVCIIKAFEFSEKLRAGVIENGDTIFIPHFKLIDRLNFAIETSNSKVKLNLMLFANSTTAMYRHGYYIKYEDEVHFYTFKYPFINKLVVLTTTLYLQRLLKKTFPKAECNNVFFEFFGYYLPYINTLEHTKEERIVITESGSGIKNSDFLIYTLEDKFPVEIVVIGNAYPPYKNFRFIENLPRHEFLSLLAKSSFFITGSIRDTLNYSLIEAYLLKCRILFPTSPIYSEIFNNGESLSYIPFDKTSLLQSLYYTAYDYTLLKDNNKNPKLISDRFKKIRERILNA